MNKDYILDNVEDFSSEQLFEFINRGVVTLVELQATQRLDSSKRTAIKNLQKMREQEDKNLEQEDNDLWKKLCYTESGCREYLEKYPNGLNVALAYETIHNFEQERIKQNAGKQNMLNKISSDSSAFTVQEIRDFLKNGIVSRTDLINCGIPEKIIENLDKIVSTQPELGETPKDIPDGYTEVYFWGIQGSGKTTALSAVLSTADRLGYLEIAQGPGYNYMLKLQNNFTNPISFLPAASPVDSTQYLPFTLKKDSEKFYRSVSLIELSGEVFQCFLYKNANKPLPTTQHEETFNSLLQFLKGKNRKLHFFFVDYDKENNLDKHGYTQSNYLNAAATFFNNPEYNLFGTTTDAIYVVVTKSDKMPNIENAVLQVKQYLNDNNYSSFINSLRGKCKKHSINNGRVLGTPFSLGKVYFYEICDFNNETSKNIIDILMRRIAPSKESILDVFNK